MPCDRKAFSMNESSDEAPAKLRTSYCKINLWMHDNANRADIRSLFLLCSLSFLSSLFLLHLLLISIASSSLFSSFSSLFFSSLSLISSPLLKSAFPRSLALHPEVRFAWSWVGYPSRRPKGCGLQSPLGPKVYPKFSLFLLSSLLPSSLFPLPSSLFPLLFFSLPFLLSPLFLLSLLPLSFLLSSKTQFSVMLEALFQSGCPYRMHPHESFLSLFSSSWRPSP